jgi:hypothetical protein
VKRKKIGRLIILFSKSDDFFCILDIHHAVFCELFHPYMGFFFQKWKVSLLTFQPKVDITIFHLFTYFFDILIYFVSNSNYLYVKVNFNFIFFVNEFNLYSQHLVKFNTSYLEFKLGHTYCFHWIHLKEVFI